MLIIKKRGGASDVSAEKQSDEKIMGLRLHIDEDLSNNELLIIIILL